MTVRPWTKELDYLLLFMRYIDIPFKRCAEYINQEAGEYIVNRNSCIGRHSRLIKNKVFYIYNHADLEE